MKIINKKTDYLDFKDDYTEYKSNIEIGSYILNQDQILYITSHSKLNFLYNDFKNLFDGNRDLSKSFRNTIDFNLAFKSFQSLSVEIDKTIKEVKPIKNKDLASLSIIQLNVSPEFNVHVRCYNNPINVFPIIFTIISVASKLFSITNTLWNYRFKYSNMFNEMVYIDSGLIHRISDFNKEDFDYNSFSLKGKIKKFNLDIIYNTSPNEGSFKSDKDYNFDLSKNINLEERNKDNEQNNFKMNSQKENSYQMT